MDEVGVQVGEEVKARVEGGGRDVTTWRREVG